MAGDPLMMTAAGLAASLDALAALTAHVRVETEGLDVPPEVRRLLACVAAELLGADDPPSVGAAAPVVGLTRAFLRQADDLVERPGRAAGWDEADTTLLQGIGRLSMGVADAIVAATRGLDGLGERVAQPGARVLDVGTGTAWLAVALARALPSVHITGLDIFEPALTLARSNVDGAGLGARIDLRLQDIVTPADQPDLLGAFDAVWLPVPFLPEDIVGPAVAASIQLLRPGGWLLPGTFAGIPGATGTDGRPHLSELLMDLRTVRSGGRAWTPAELLDMLRAAGLVEVTEVPRAWAAPVRLYAGRRPA